MERSAAKALKLLYARIGSHRIRETPAGFMHDFDPRNAFDVPKEERLARYEELWAQPGFTKWLANFHDIMTNREANEDFAEFIRNKIRARVKDPVVAEKLCPKNHPFGSKRIPLETNYYETYNQDNVLLVDVREAPIERITPKGVKTKDKEYEFDVIIYATGFDAITGALTSIDIRGEGEANPLGQMGQEWTQHVLGTANRRVSESLHRYECGVLQLHRMRRDARGVDYRLHSPHTREGLQTYCTHQTSGRSLGRACS